ncbi:MAG: hypothetical protein WBH99_00285 [Azovibrio sp.]|uniref:hypothetical protein n=1 Tax=Azovibrio sp. TaxID=1872673 RepID=UPI003C7512AD
MLATPPSISVTQKSGMDHISILPSFSRASEFLVDEVRFWGSFIVGCCPVTNRNGSLELPGFLDLPVQHGRGNRFAQQNPTFGLHRLLHC